MNEAIYQNDNYRVDATIIEDEDNLFTDGRWGYAQVYIVTNVNTLVIEHTCVQLPEACFTAASLDAALKRAPWDWANSLSDAIEQDGPDSVN